ncbi:MAG: hypothetical protein HY722_06910 [Planctomycetes bacterium]|nr:hypothetical protein [Planctomycetota bacterium]
MTYIFVLGVLSMLMLYAAVLVTVTRVESMVTRDYFDGLHAQTAARTGIEMALADLRRWAERNSIDPANAPWAYKAGPMKPLAEVTDATQASYYGTSATTSEYTADYRVKVVDCASQINLNGPQVSLGYMLEILGDEISRTYGPANPIPSGFGASIVSFRLGLPGRRFRSERQLLDLMASDEYSRVTGVSNVEEKERVARERALARWNVLRDFVTVQGWADGTALKPSLGTEFPGDLRALETQARYPINVNGAPKPVLVAALAGLTGYKLTQRALSATEEQSLGLQTITGNKLVRLERVALDPITIVQARFLADRLIAARPFRTWAAFEAAVASAVANAGFALSTAQQTALDAHNNQTALIEGPFRTIGAAEFKGYYGSMVLASANPNARLNALAPDPCASLAVDKASLRYQPQSTGTTTGGTSTQALLSGTTEFCFSSMGWYELEALGRLVSRLDGTVSSTYAESAAAKVFDVFRHTTQRDFEQSRVSALRMASGPEQVRYASGVDGYQTLGTEWQAAQSPFSALFGGGLAANTADGGGAPLAGSPAPQKQADRGLTEVLEAGGLGAYGVLSLLGTPASAGNTASSALVYKGAGNIPMVSTPYGSLEFWVKFLSPTLEGTQELLAYFMLPDTLNPYHENGQRLGITYRIERLGRTIRVTGLYWHFLNESEYNAYKAFLAGSGTDPRKPEWRSRWTWCFAMSEYNMPTTVAPFQWHQVGLRWGYSAGSEANNPFKHHIFFDGVKAPWTWAPTSGGTNPLLTDKDGSGGTQVYKQKGQTKTTTTTSGDFFGATKTTTTTYGEDTGIQQVWNLIRLASAVPSGDTVGTFGLAGYQFTKPYDEDKALYNMELRIRVGSVQRFANVMIDNVRLGTQNPNTAGNDTQTSRPDRYYLVTSTNPASMTHTMVSARPGGAARLGTISCTLGVPPGSSLSTFSPSISVAGATLQGADGDSGVSQDGRGLRLAAGSGTGAKNLDVTGPVQYTLQFGASANPSLVTPVVDDVTVTVVGTSQVIWD